MPRFTYRRTEELGCFEARIQPQNRMIGYVRRLQRGWAYRALKNAHWSYGPALRFEAAEALLDVEAIVRD